jgi:transcriptional regulator with XRE-family HTH domain
MAKNYPKLAKILKKLLFEKDMKVTDLARKLDIPQPTIHRLVSGKSTRPYKSSLEPIANYFSITVDQLLGEDDSQEPSTFPTKEVTSIPIYQWEVLPNQQSAPPIQTITANNTSDKAFALVMPDTSMEPIFPKSSILIFDPEMPAKDRSYVLAFIKESSLSIFRQLLIDADHKYLKPLNPDLSDFKMRLLDKDDIIIASLIESRMDHRLSKLIEPLKINEA